MIDPFLLAVGVFMGIIYLIFPFSIISRLGKIIELQKQQNRMLSDLLLSNAPPVPPEESALTLEDSDEHL